MGSGKWTWTVLVAAGGLAWACGGNDDSHGSNDSESTSSTGGNAGTTSGGTASDGGTAGTAPNTTGNGTGGDAGGVGTTTSGATTTSSNGGTTTTGSDTGGTAGGAGAAGAAGMAGAAGAPAELTGDDIRVLCEADCAHLSGVGCPDFEADACVEDVCMYFYIPGCEAEYAAFLECDTAADASDPNEYYCFDDATPSSAASCSDLFGALLACTP